MNQPHRLVAFAPRNRLAPPVIASCALLLLNGCFFSHRGTTTTATAASAPAPVAKVKPVVRPAPDFLWVGAGGKTFSLKTLRGQPVVLLIGTTPDDHEFRKQVGRIDSLYLDLSERKAVFLAAFTGQPARVMSNVPYAVAANGGAVAKAYGVPPGGFGVAVISPDGNMDFFSTQVEAAQRLLDTINNSYQTQAASRTGLGS